MKSEVTATESPLVATENPSCGDLDARAEPIRDPQSAIGNPEQSCPGSDNDESTAKYLFKLSRDVILSLDRCGNILCINQRGIQLSGYSEAELRGANISELLLLLEDRAAIHQILHDLVQGKVREYEIRWKTKAGAVLHFDGVSVPRLSDSGEFLSTLCTLRDVTERKSTEEKLRKSEEKYRDLIEISPDAIYVVDADGICVLGNRAGAELAGIPPDELVGTPVTETYFPEERHLFRERLEKLRTGGTLRFERTFVRKNGEIVPVEVSVTAIRGGYFQAILRDISKRKQGEALLAGEKRLLEMVANGDALSAILDAICRLVEELCSGCLCSILLLDSSGKRLCHGAGPSIPTPYAQAIDCFVIGPNVGSCGSAAYRAEQVIVSNIATDPLWARFRDVALTNGLKACWSMPILSFENRVLGTFAMYYREPRSPARQHQEVIEQITHLASIAIERKRAEEALKESEERYRVLVEFSPNSICVHQDGKLLYVNPAGVRLFGATNRDELVGRSVLDFIHPDSLPVVRERIRQVGAGGTAPLIEEKFVTLNGEVRDVEVTSIPIIYERAPAAQVIIRDITERKQSEAILAGEKRLLEMIATGVELKEILNALCLTIEGQRSGALASVLLLNPDGAHLDVVAGPSLPNEWTQQMEKLPIGPCAGSCGTAAYRGLPVIVSDIANDPLWEVPEHRAAALSHGLRASWSNPILSSEGKVLGTFCIYGREPQSPSPHDLGVMEKATHLARVAIERDRSEAAVRTSEEKYRDLINASPDAICVIDADAKCVLVNPAGVKLAGRSEEELIGSSIAETYLPEERYLLEDRLEKLKAEGSFRFERKFLRKNGDVIPVEVPLSAVRGRYYQAIIRDISQRKRREALLAGENRILEMLARGDSLADILDLLCLLVEEQSTGVLASILLMDANGKQLRHGGAPNLPKAYTEAIDGAFIGASVGSCGTAAYRAEQVIVSDIATDPLWADFRDLALAHSLRACWSTPIFSSEGKVIGTFAMYYREPRSPSPREQDTIKHITHLAGIAIQRKLAETARRESEAYLAEAQRLSHTGSWAWAPASGEIRYWSEETYRVLGFDPEPGPPRFETFFERLCPEA